MRKLYILICFLLVSSLSFAQMDSTYRETLKFKNAPWYFRASPLTIFTMAAKFPDRVAQNFEFGKSFDAVDLGLSVGRNTLRRDSTLFVEAKVTMDVCNFGIFANEMTIGAGKLFNKQGSLMLELSYTLYAQIRPKLGIGITTGYYDFSNAAIETSQNFFGLFCRYGISRTDTGGLLNRNGRPRIGHARGHHR